MFTDDFHPPKLNWLKIAIVTYCTSLLKEWRGDLVCCSHLHPGLWCGWYCVQFQSWVIVRVGVLGIAIQRLDCHGNFCFQNGTFTRLATWSQFSAGVSKSLPRAAWVSHFLMEMHGSSLWIPQILPGSTRKEKVAGILWSRFKVNSAFYILLVEAIKVQPGSRGERISLFLMEEQYSIKSIKRWDVFHHSGLESWAWHSSWWKLRGHC